MCKECEEKEKIRKVFLDDLPKHKGTNNGKINWKKSIGHKIKFIYDDIEGEIEVVDYQAKGQYLYMKYLGYDLLKITTRSFIKCGIGRLLKRITNDFKIEIGTIFKDNTRDLVIIDREYKKDIHEVDRKYYKYHCNKCGYEGWIIEYNLLNGARCFCCINQVTVLGVNTIWDTDRWMCDLGVSEEDAKKYTKSSSVKIYPICPCCGRIKNNGIYIYNIYSAKTIWCQCSDGYSYPNKFICELLNQLNDIYNFNNMFFEYSPDWIKPKRYDSYFKINNKEYIVEMDGALGHGKRIHSKDKKSIQESIDIDNYKDLKAKEHGIEVIRINCDRSDLEFIKNNILNSKLVEVFDLNNIDWIKCEEFALSNIVKKVCELKSNNPDISTEEIRKMVNLNRSTVIRYLEKGAKLGWCNYNPKEELKKSNAKNGKLHGKSVEIYNKNGIFLGTFESCGELTRISKELFGVKFDQANISSVCLGKRPHHHGFSFKYVEDIT